MPLAGGDPMNNIQQETLSRIIGSTHNVIDCHKCIAALAYAKSKGIESECRGMILAARISNLNWWTITQRKWQRLTRNPNKARHHDSVSLREKYVRC